MHILILGGTSEASALTNALAARPDIRATLSLAGRTQNPVLPRIECRVGGFGGAGGLAAWMRQHEVTALIDATHPFARIMPFNAVEAAHIANVPLLSLLRPEWQPEAGDNWTQVPDHNEAISILGSAPRRVFLTVGRLEINAYTIAPQHFYVVRSIDPVEPKPLPNAVWLMARGPFSIDSEGALLKEHNIDAVITKNSGGEATQAKLVAARKLGLPVILIARPPRPDTEHVATAEEAMNWIARIHDASL